VKRLQIDFVGRGKASPWPGRMLLALALAFSLDVAMSYQDARNSLRLNQAKMATAQARSGAPAIAVSPEEAAAVRETVERLAMPWDKLFGALEATASDQVALLGIEPDPKAGTVVISGDSKDYLAALTYVLNLSRAEALTRVQLLRHEAKGNDPQAAVSFAVSAAWSKGK
jgi:hypothetical protein